MTRDTYACGDCAVVVDVTRSGRFWHAGVGKWLCGKCFDAARAAEWAEKSKATSLRGQREPGSEG